MSGKERKAAVEALKIRLSENRSAQEQALRFLYNLQSLDERLDGVTVYANGRGVGTYDAQYVTVAFGQLHDEGQLGGELAVLAAVKLPKYAGQLLDAGLMTA